MEIFTIINRYGMPLLITVLYIILYANWRTLKPKIKEMWKKDVVLLFEENLNVDFGKPALTILLPIIGIMILDTLIIIIFGSPMTSSDPNLIRAIVFSGLLNPISEEIIFRGTFLGCIFLSFIDSAKRKYKKLKKFEYILILLALLLQAIIFTSQHENYNLFQIVIRTSHGIYYGLLYILYKRNLLPCIVAHSGHNLFLVFMTT